MSVGAPLPGTGESTKTALLEDGTLATGADVAADPVTATAPPPANPSPARASKRKQDRGEYSYRRSSRSVQNLFLHPLGRM
jgi:hypothetical protein